MDDELSPEEVENLSNAIEKKGHGSDDYSGSTVSRAQFLQLEELAQAADLPPQDMERMHDVKVRLEVILGKSRKTLDEVLHLHAGSVVELDKLAGEPVDITANGKLIARGEIVVVEDNFGVKILEIAGVQKKLEVI